MNFPDKKYDLVLLDPPWPYYGDPNKPQAAGKHYALMTEEEIFALPIRQLLKPMGVALVWATSPKLNLAIKAIESWGLHYRGVAFVWAKTNSAGRLINGQGVRPTITKPTSEFLLAASTKRTGRPLKLQTEAMPQVHPAPRPGGIHSRKPPIFHEAIENLFGSVERLELFARAPRVGWDVWGNETDKFEGEANGS